MQLQGAVEFAGASPAVVSHPFLYIQTLFIGAGFSFLFAEGPQPLLFTSVVIYEHQCEYTAKLQYLPFSSIFLVRILRLSIN